MENYLYDPTVPQPHPWPQQNTVSRYYDTDYGIDGVPSGVGADAAVAITTGGMVAIGLGVLIVGALSYQVGKRLAPSQKDEVTWGAIAVPAGIFTGPIGLGIMAMLSKR